MSWIIVGLLVLALNAYLGVEYVKEGKTTKSAAFTWFIVGFVAYSIIDLIN